MTIKTCELVRSQYCFLNGSSDSITVDFNDTQIMCQNDETLSITIEEFSLKLYNYIVSAGNNSLTFVGPTTQTITLDPGTYSVFDLAGYVTALMGSALGSLTYNQFANTFTFNLTWSYTLHFTGTAYSLFGFAATDVPSGTAISSTSQVNLKPADNIFVRAEGINGVISHNFENFRTGDLQLSNILAMIPFTFESPWSPMWFHNENSRYEMFIREKVMDTLNLSFVDNKGQLIDFIRDYVIVLRFNTYKTNPVDNSAKATDLLEKILRISTSQFTLTNLDLIDVGGLKKNMR